MKRPSLNKIVAELRSALQPIREALTSTATGQHSPVECYGYLFTGSRQYKARTTPGPAWVAYYQGCRQGARPVAGSLDEVANQIYARQVKEYQTQTSL